MSRTYGRATYHPPETARSVNGSWVLVLEPHVAMKLKHVFRRVDAKQHGQLTMRDTAEICRDLQWFMTRYPLELDAASLAHLRARSDYHRKTITAVESVLNGQYEPRAFDLAIPPRDYQRIAADITLRFGGLLLADDVGLGKTVSAIAVLSDPRARPALVVTLTHLPRQWEREIKRFAPGMRVHVARQGTPYDISGTPRKKQGGIFEPTPGSMPDILIMNYEKLSGWADELAPHIRGVVFDEVQSLRHTGTNKYSAAQHVAGHAEVKLGLAATPIYNFGSEFYAVVEVLRPGELGGPSEFHTEWCGAVDQRGRALIGDTKAFGLYLREAGIMLRRTKKEVGRELPPVQRIPHFVESDEKALDDIQKDVAELARLLLGSGGSGLSKMRAAEEIDYKLRQATGIAKAPYVAAFVRLLVESGRKVLLYGWHHAVYAIWERELMDLEVTKFTGHESEAQKRAAIERFCKKEGDGGAQVLMMSLRAGAGIDGLQHVCSTVVYGELDWSPGVHEQCTGRLDRDGQEESVSEYWMLADKGSDPVISDMLGIKTQQAHGVLNPSADLVAKLEVDPNRVKKLAQAYLDSLNAKSPEPP